MRILPAAPCLALLAATAAGALRAAAPPPLDPAAARVVFREARSETDHDHGKLWGLSLSGPILLVDPGTRRVIASARDQDGALTAESGVFVGELPDSVNVANTALDWGGTLWSMLMWPLPEAAADRHILLAHELWHRVQSRLGLPSRPADNRHLDTPEGRVWMRLEWHALARALVTHGAAQLEAIADALAFRTHRRAIFPGAAAAENALELNEGLAEYTGVMLGTRRHGRRAALLADLARAERAASYVRSFAYGSGPAYGALLDRESPGWREDLAPDADLGARLDAALGIPAGAETAGLERRAMRYGADTLRAVEEARERARAARRAAARTRFAAGRVLVLPLRAPQVSFDPRSLEPLDSLGTVYPTMHVSDVWGILDVTRGGALLARDWSRVTVPAAPDTAGSAFRGDGWTLELRPGWRLTAGGQPGDQQLEAVAPH